MTPSPSSLHQKWRLIGTRLFLAFGLVAATTVISALVAWLAVNRISNDLSDASETQLETTSIAARMADIGGNIRAEMPKLLTAISEDERIKTHKNITENITRLRQQLNLNARNTNETLLELLQKIAANVELVDNNVDQRLRLKNQNEELIERLRWAHADFLDEIDPIVADASFNMTNALQKLDRIDSSTQLDQSRRTIRNMAQTNEAIMRINAASNLSIGLIMRGAVQESAYEIEGIRQFLQGVTGQLKTSSALIQEESSAISLRQAINQIVDFSEGPNDILGIRQSELSVKEKGQELLSQNRYLFLQLESQLSKQIADAEQNARQSITETQNKIQKEKLFLILASLLSIMIFLLVGWGYVKTHIVSRLNALRQNMDEIATGNLDVDVETSGQDEISEMAQTLLVFRNTAKENKLAQEELLQATKLAVLGQMSAGIAHETNQTLAAITYNAHNAKILLQRERTAEAQAFIEKIGQLAEKMGKTVNHLKVFARKPSDEIRPILMGETINNALSLFDDRFKKSNVHLDISAIDADLRVMAENIRLEQVIVNIIANALDAMPGKEDDRLVISCYADGANGIIKIADNGLGIDDETLEKIFDPFFTTKKEGRGLGLGLSISQKIIKDLGGLLEVSSAPNTGTTFKIILKQEK